MVEAFFFWCDRSLVQAEALCLGRCSIGGFVGGFVGLGPVGNVGRDRAYFEIRCGLHIARAV